MVYYLTKEKRWNDLVSGIVGVLDIIAGVLVYLSGNVDFTSSTIIVSLSCFYFCLGIWALGINIKRKNYLEWRGVVDLITAICLFLVYSGSVYEIFGIIGIIIVIKGILGLFLITASEY